MFTLENESDTHYTIKHPKGDVLKIAKKGLSPQAHTDIKKLSQGGQNNPKLQQSKIKNYDEGGKVEESKLNEFKNLINGNSAADSQPTDDSQNTGHTFNFNIGQPQPQTTPEGQNVASAIPTNPNLPQASVPRDPNQLPNVTGQLQNDINSYQQGAQQKANVESQEGQQLAGQYGQQGQNEQDFQNKFTQNFQEEQSNLKKVADDYANGHIDFNRAWNNKSTGQKVLAGLGIALAGIGSGLTHQPNQALQVINNEIERDIRGQMAEGEQKKNAFSMYKQYYGNNEQAYLAQKLSSQAMVASKMNEIISKNAGPMAQAQKQMLLGQMLPSMQKDLYNLSLQRTMYQQFMGGSGGGNQLTSGQGQSGARMQNISAPASQNINANSQDSGIPDIGRTGSVDLDKLGAGQLSGIIPKEDAATAIKEAKDFQESQSTKRLLLNDLSQMSDSVVKDRQQIAKTPGIGMSDLTLEKLRQSGSKLPFVGEAVGESQPWGGAIGRQYATARASALNKINTLLTKRIGGEGMKNIKVMLPDQEDSDEEIKSKIERIMNLIDTNTATPTLDKWKLIRGIGQHRG